MRPRRIRALSGGMSVATVIAAKTFKAANVTEPSCAKTKLCLRFGYTIGKARLRDASIFQVVSAPGSTGAYAVFPRLSLHQFHPNCVYDAGRVILRFAAQQQSPVGKSKTSG
ncbi:hypothetical protein QE435_001150 [Rhizobium sp. SORGH_AS 787]|nr:hypothetical protein [Rhizobium sp. SORGH_AS_0787]